MVVFLCLSVLTAGAWAWLLMAPDLPIAGVICGRGGLQWSFAHLGLTMAMWLAMSIAMMAPVAARDLLRLIPRRAIRAAPVWA